MVSFFSLENPSLDRGQRVDDGAVPDALKVTKINATFDTGLMQVHCILHAQVVKGGTQRGGEMFAGRNE